MAFGGFFVLGFVQDAIFFFLATRGAFWKMLEKKHLSDMEFRMVHGTFFS